MKYKTEYKLVDTRTLEGLREAERLKARGWTISRVGFYFIQFYRRTEVKA